MHRGGVPEEDKRRLYQHAHLTRAEQDAIDSLAYMGVSLTKVKVSLSAICTRSSCFVKGATGKLNLKLKHEESEYELSRYMPLLRTIVEVPWLWC